MFEPIHHLPGLIRACAPTLHPEKSCYHRILLGLGVCAGGEQLLDCLPGQCAVSLELGESLAAGKGYVFNEEPHTYVPPGYPLMITAVAKVFGHGSQAYRVLMSVLGLLAAVLGVLLVVRLFGRDVGLLAGGLFAVNHVLLENSTLITSDVPFAVVALAGLNAVVSAGGRQRGQATLVLVAALTVGLAPLIARQRLGSSTGCHYVICGFVGSERAGYRGSSGWEYSWQ